VRTFLQGDRGRRVGGTGPLGARAVILGEALGADEERGNAPFIGRAGQFLFEGRDYSGSTRWQGLDSTELRRRDIRIENVMEVRPLENSLFNVTPAQVEKWQADWWRRAGRLEGPNVIVPVGNLALNTLRRAPLPVNPKTGKWRVRSSPMGPQIDWRDKITNWRGSIFWIRLENGRKVKCIPTYHPAYVLRAGDYFDVWQGDWGRIVEDATFPELRLDPATEHLIHPTKGDLEDFYQVVERTWRKDKKGAVLAGDIETVAKRFVDCMGFSVDERFSITLDLRQSWQWRWVAQLLRHPIAKGWHYGLFDTFVLASKGIRIEKALWWDSQQMHHCMDPRDEHRLAYCASRDLGVRYWKDEGKEEGKSSGVKDPDKRHRYCGKDVARTLALIVRYRERHREMGLRRVYREHYRRLSAACFRLSRTGFLVDNDARKAIAEREKGILKEIRGRLAGTCGTDLIAKKGFSAPRVAAYFYDKLGCKAFRKRGSGTRTCDELAIRRLMRKYKKARPAGADILAYREHAKIRQEVRGVLVDDDGRMRSLYTPTAKTGRLRSRKTPVGTGINAQNRDRHSDLRRMFVADPGCVLLEVDESQAEDRMVDGMSGDPEGRRLAQRTDIDRHILNATKVFGVDYDELLAAYLAGDPEADKKRQLGKRTRHAVNYGMEGERMAEMALLETEGRLVLEKEECEEWIENLLKGMPWIEGYHEWVIRDMVEKGYLESSWGRRVYFRGLRLTKEDHKEGFAWRPQHEVGVLMNQEGFIPVDEAIQQRWWPGAKIVQQNHDSLAVSTPPQFAWKIALMLEKRLTTERTYLGRNGVWRLAMPVGVKVGRSWWGMKEWKGLPSKEEFEEEVRRVRA